MIMMDYSDMLSGEKVGLVQDFTKEVDQPEGGPLL